MIWFVWRRHRAVLRLIAGVVRAWVVVLVVGRLRYATELAGLGLSESCLADPGCANPALLALSGDYRYFWGLGHSALLVTPLILGLIAGAGLFGRELEQGTHVLALTQRLGRARWWGVLVAVTGGTAVAGSVVLSLVTGWAFAPLDATTTSISVLETPRFEVSGVVPVAYTLLAFGVSAAAGLVSRSSLAAVVAGIAVYGVVMFVLATGLRAHHLPPETVRTDVSAGQASLGFVTPEGSWLLNQRLIDERGGTVAERTLYGPGGTYTDLAVDDCFRRVGIVAVDSDVQPASRYLPFQLIESAILVVLSALALAGSYARLRSRVAT